MKNLKSRLKYTILRLSKVRYFNRWVIFLGDLILSIIATALIEVFMETSLHIPVFSTSLLILASLVVSVAAIFMFRTYIGVIRYATLREVWRLMFMAIAKELMLGVCILWGNLLPGHIYLFLFADFFVTFTFMLGARLVLLYVYNAVLLSTYVKKKNVLIYGIGENSVKLAQGATKVYMSDYVVRGFLAMKHNKRHFRISGYSVYGIENEEELRNLKEGTVIIRSHGVAKDIYRIIEENGLEYEDATCPFVKRIHSIVEKESAEGKQIIIIGNEGHPEVEGIRGWASTPAIVVESHEQAEKITIESDKKVCIVSQTTFNYRKFQELVEIFTKKGYDVSVANTICNATEVRQKEAREIADEADVMIVIGGAHSSNSRKLYEICAKECENTHFIQTLEDLHLDLPKSVELVGITAGASTPNKIIEEVQNYVRINF